MICVRVEQIWVRACIGAGLASRGVLWEPNEKFRDFCGLGFEGWRFRMLRLRLRGLKPWDKAPLMDHLATHTLDSLDRTLSIRGGRR